LESARRFDVHNETHIAAGRFAHHGGRLGVARSLFPDLPQPWIDLSTGINPRSCPVPRASQRARNRLPEPTELARLEALAAEAFG
jgi:cobalamin biosynthetic protein CobC